MRSKDEVFLALLTDAVAHTYAVPGVAADRPLTIPELQARLDLAGLLDDAPDE